MSHRSARREFLRNAGLLAAGAVGGLAGGMMPLETAAIEPIRRDGQARFKFSLAAYSYRSLLGGANPQLTLEDFIDDCARMGLDGTELTSYYFPADADERYLLSLKRRAFLLGLDVSGTAVGNDFCHPPGEKRDEQIALVNKWVDRAAVLTAPVIRIFSGRPGKGQSAEEAHRLAVEGIQQCCDYAATKGVFLALENHGGLTTEPEGLLALVRDVDSPWFGVNVDTGNFHTADPYADLARIAPYAVNVQVKVAMQPGGRDRKKVPADFSRLAQIMRDAAYRGYIVLEYEEPEDPRQACPRYIDEIRRAFA